MSRLWANTRTEGVGIGESIRMLQSNVSQASVLQGNNKVAFDSLVWLLDEDAAEANHRAVNAVESDVDGIEVESGTEDDSTENKDQNRAVALQLQQSGRRNRNGQRGPSGGRIGLYSAAINKGKGKSPSKSPMRCNERKGVAQVRKTENPPASPLPDSEIVAINPESQWPTGTRKAFSAAMPLFYEKVFSSSTPLRVAHLLIEQLCHGPVVNAD